MNVLVQIASKMGLQKKIYVLAKKLNDQKLAWFACWNLILIITTIFNYLCYKVISLIGYQICFGRIATQMHDTKVAT
jgi:hypothetical protein